MSIKDLQIIDNKTKDLVKGWIKNQKKLPNIPDLITALCIIYYHIKEKFIKSGDCIKIIKKVNIKDTFIIQNCNMMKYNSSCVYGSININQNRNDVIEWTYKINNIPQNIINFDYSHNIAIGITNLIENFNKYAFCPSLVTIDNCFKWIAYGIAAGGDKYKIGGGTHYSGWIDTVEHITNKRKHNMHWQTNDIIKMVLWVKNNTLEFYRNGLRITTFNDINFHDDEEINMVVTLRGCKFMRGLSITLLDFKTEHNN